MKVREIINLIQDNNLVLDRMTGSHRQFYHPTKRGAMTVAGPLNDDLPKKTQDSILKQAGLR